MLARSFPGRARPEPAAGAMKWADLTMTATPDMPRSARSMSGRQASGSRGNPRLAARPALAAATGSAPSALASSSPATRRKILSISLESIQAPLAML